MKNKEGTEGYLITKEKTVGEVTYKLYGETWMSYPNSDQAKLVTRYWVSSEYTTEWALGIRRHITDLYTGEDGAKAEQIYDQEIKKAQKQ